MGATQLNSRRNFLKAGAASSLVIGFQLPLAGRLEAATAKSGAEATTFQPNAFLRIGSDNQVTVLCGSAEMGQGVLTAIPMLVAEQLDADWSRIHVEQAPADPAYNNPLFGMQATGGSTTIRAFYEPMQKAGAAARDMLIQAAAQRWKTTTGQCSARDGYIVHDSGKKLSFGQLAADASKLPVPEQPKLKPTALFRLIGKPTNRLDSPAKVNGTAKYGIDTALPGMLVAVMARAPLAGVKPKQYNEAAARAVKGVRQVIVIPSGVAVLATGYWAAKKGRDALAVDWDLGAQAAFSSALVSQMLSDGTDNAKAVAKDAGSLKDGNAAAATVLKAQYEVPYLAHACMEPMNCTAWVLADGVELWVGTQSQGPSQGILSQVASVTPGQVRVHTQMLGGGFGRRFAPDFTIDATLLSKIAGAPVKLIYSREDDMAAGYFRPASMVKFEGGIDASGKPTLLRADVSSPSIMEGSGFMKLPADGVDSFAMEGIADNPYDIANMRLAYGRREPGPQVWFWRSVGHSQNIYFIESFIDEMAAAAKQDPFEFRRKLLDKQPRYKAVLEAAAAQAGWGKALPAGRFRGIAVAQSFGSYVAEVAEVSIGADGTPTVHRVVAAVDCGLTVNPQTIARQIEGSIVFGLSAALSGRISYKDGRVEQTNFNNYPVLRMSQMPAVEVHILRSTEAPGGIGEPGTPPIAPAVANAIFAATGQRLRSLPFDTSLLRRA